MYWYSQNNKLIIQVLAVLIGIVLITLVYRLFFGPAESEEASSNVKLNQIQDFDKKISSVMSAIENLKAPASTVSDSKAEETVTVQAAETPVSSALTSESQPVEASAPAEPAAAASNSVESSVASAPASEVIVENEALKKDLDTVKTSVKAKDKELEDLKQQLSEQKKLLEKGSKGTTRTMIDTSTLNGDKDLIAKIDELQKKLSEYDIIADDISELQTLRKENSELKEKIGGTAAPAGDNA